MAAIEKNNSNGGIGFVGLLTILFIALKLLKVITWSWWWVLSPIWISVGALLLVFGVILLVMVIVDAVEKHKRSKLSHHNFE